MDTNNQSMLIDGANPSMLWYNIAEYISNLSKSMVKTYNQRQRSNKPITWGELDKVNQDLHNQLDIIISGDRNVKTISENIKMNKKQTIRLNESQFNNLVKKVVKESVKKVLFEERPPVLDSEIAMGEHERNFDFRVTKVIQNCVQSLRDCIIDDEFGEKIDYMFAPKIDKAIRNVLREYGLLN